MMVPRYILLQPIPVAFLIRIIMLDSPFKEAILSGVVVPASLRFVVRWVRVRSVLLFDGLCVGSSMVQLLVARVMLVCAAVVGHGVLSQIGL